jgi:hypothetical protein
MSFNSLRFICHLGGAHLLVCHHRRSKASAQEVQRRGVDDVHRVEAPGICPRLELFADVCKDGKWR